MRLVVGRPNIPDEFRILYHLTEILKTRRLTNNGPLVRELERRIQEALGVKHCIAVANGTLGLQIAAKALDLTGEVIMPSWTFVATAHAMKWIGLEPVFVDVAGHHIDPVLVSRAVTDRTSAILGVHTWGQPCNTMLQFLADGYDIALIYDAAHAFGCSCGNQMIGNFGDCEVFSFHATKFFNTFEGGAITTNNDDLAERCRRLRNFGFVDYDTVMDIGINAKMSEIHAAMGLCLLEYPLIIPNKRNYLLYKERLGDAVLTHNDKSNYWYIVVESDNRDRIVEELAKKDIQARKYFYPGVHQMPPYNQRDWDLPNTERLAERTLCLPNGPTVTEDDINEICEVVLRWS